MASAGPRLFRGEGGICPDGKAAADPFKTMIIDGQVAARAIC
jgi:hypothetical protein